MGLKNYINLKKKSLHTKLNVLILMKTETVNLIVSKLVEVLKKIYVSAMNIRNKNRKNAVNGQKGTVWYFKFRTLANTAK